MEAKEFAREALAQFFRRRDVAGKLYCAACLAPEITRRSRGAFSQASLGAAVAEAFERPAPLQVAPRGPCAICQKRRPCLGTGRRGL